MEKARKKHPGRVAIIGAGVAGCAAAGALQDYGVDFVVYEKNDGPGGLWKNNYPGASVQSTFELYEYPCKRFPAAIRNRKDPPGPTAEEVCTYLDEYIDQKGMRSKFQFGNKIVAILCNSEKEWIIEFEDFTTESFAFVIVSSGLVSMKPHTVNFPGTQAFLAGGGQILHSSERTSNDVFVGKRVIVVGNGKSAVDAVSAASDVAILNGTSPPIQLARRQTWYVPRYILGVIQYKWAFHTRLGSALLPTYYDTAILLKFLHFLFSPLKWILWRLVELILLCQFRLPYRLWPQMLTIEATAVENSVLITDESHLRRLRRGEVDMRIGIIERLKAGKAIFQNGTEEEVDVIVQATGWSLAFDKVIDEDSILAGLDFMTEGLDFCEDGLWLYRNILPASFRGIAFVGSNTLTFMNIFTSYVQAYWLAQLLVGERPWPKRSIMKAAVEKDKVFKRKYYRNSEMRGASIEAYMQHYHDILYREMNARKAFPCCLIRPIADLVVPVIPYLMQGCLEPIDVDKKRKSKTSKHISKDKSASVPLERAVSAGATDDGVELEALEEGQRTSMSRRVDMAGETNTDVSSHESGRRSIDGSVGSTGRT